MTTKIALVELADVGVWCEMPVSYDPARITADDIQSDRAIRRLTRREAEICEGAASGRVRVESTTGTDDDEAGYATLRDGVLSVAWDSGVTTPCDVSSLIEGSA